MSHSEDWVPDNVVRLPTSDPGARDEDLLDDLLAADESVEALREALEDLRREIRSRLPAERSASGMSTVFEDFDPIALFDELRRRLARFGMDERLAEVDEFGMDAQMLNRARPIMDFLQDRYWRAEVRGLENVPRGGPCLFVANHSGLLPYDGMMLSHVLERAGAAPGRPRFLVADWLITLPFMQPYLARIGGVRACRENADRLLRTGRSVIAFPEGIKGAAKPFRERYRLKRFGRGGVVRAALAAGVPLVPVGVVGAEEAHPVLMKSHVPARMLGLPFIPITPTFPILGPLGLLPLPARWVIQFGSPIDLHEEAHQGDEAAGPDNEELLISRLTEELRGQIQALVDEGLEWRESVWS